MGWMNFVTGGLAGLLTGGNKKKKKEQQKYDQMIGTIQGWIDRATTPSPVENDITADYNATRSFLDSKDYRNLPTGVNIDLLNLSDYQDMRKRVRGSDEGAQRAAGASHAPMVHAQREMDDNQFVSDWGGAYEEKVGGLMDKKDSMAKTLQDLYGNRMRTGIEGSQMQFQNFLDYKRNKPQGNNMQWLQMLAQAAPSIIAAV